MGNPRLNTMAKGEAMTPVPEGEITTTQSWSQEPKMVTVTCYHCAKTYEVIETDVRTNNYCMQCK